jgi:hypothetical protein
MKYSEKPVCIGTEYDLIEEEISTKRTRKTK